MCNTTHRQERYWVVALLIINSCLRGIVNYSAAKKYWYLVGQVGQSAVKFRNYSSINNYL